MRGRDTKKTHLKVVLPLLLSGLGAGATSYAQDDPFAEMEAELNTVPAQQAPTSSSQQAADAFAEMEAEMGQFSVAGQAEEEAEYQAWLQQQEEEFNAWKKQYFEELEHYKNNIAKHWATIEVTDQQTYVEYSDDMETKRVVDYENNEIRISIQDENASEEQVKALVQEQIEALVEITPNQARANDPVLTAIEAETQAEDEISNAALLSELTPISVKSERVSKAEIDKVVRELMSRAQVEPVKAQANEQLKPVREVVIPLPSAAVLKRAEKYKSLVAKYSNSTDIEPALVYAIMHTESSFNPMARSAIPAFGLMQIVPGSAGIDVAVEIYGERRVFEPEYLFNAENNIQAGSTYLKILYFRYLRKIENPESRWYCAIAAYNTGAGNVARAFSGGTRLDKATLTINSLPPQQVYDTLIAKLPYDETKKYLEKVVDRRNSYRQVKI